MQDTAHPEKGADAEGASYYRDRDQFRFLIVGGAICGDIAVIGVAALMASWLRFGDFISGNTIDLLVVILFPYGLATLVLEACQLHHLRKRTSSVRRAVIAFMASFIVAVIAAFAFKVSATYSRLETGYLVILAALGLILWRSALSSVINRWFVSIVEPVIIILGDLAGLADDRLHEVAKEVIDVGERGWTPRYDDPDFLDRLSNEIGVADRIILAFGDDQVCDNWVSLARVKGLNAEIWQPNYLATRTLGLNDLNGLSTLVVSRGPLRFYERVEKRLFDLCLTIPGLIFLSPLMVILAVLIKIDSPGSVIFAQKRIGVKNRQITVYKFRTLRSDALEPNGILQVTRDDDRVTRLGRLLRMSSLDELPQLINVLKGEMSLVGPRPHAPAMRTGGKPNWFAVDDYWSRHAIKPGITGLAQVRGYRGETITEQHLKNRVDADMEYINNWSLFLDLKILFKTINVITHPSAY